MSQTLSIPANERGVVRVFSLAMDDGDARGLLPGGADEAHRRSRLTALLGATDLNLDYVSVLDLKALEEVGLAIYLSEGQDISAADLEPDEQKLSGLKGWALIVVSPAFGATDQTLHLDTALTLIGTYHQQSIDWSPIAIDTDSAAPPETAYKPPKSEARISGMIATAVLLFLAVFVALLVLMSG